MFAGIEVDDEDQSRGAQLCDRRNLPSWVTSAVNRSANLARSSGP